MQTQTHQKYRRHPDLFSLKTWLLPRADGYEAALPHHQQLKAPAFTHHTHNQAHRWKLVTILTTSHASGRDLDIPPLPLPLRFRVRMTMHDSSHHPQSFLRRTKKSLDRHPRFCEEVRPTPASIHLAGTTHESLANPQLFSAIYTAAS